ALLHCALDACGGDPMFLVVGDLLTPAIFGDCHELLNTLRIGIGKQNDFSVNVTRRPASRLNKGGLASQEAFFVSVKYTNQAYFRKIQPFAQKIDPNQDVEFSSSKGSQYFNPLDRVDLTMQIADFETDVSQVIRQIFSRSLRQGRNQNALPALRSFPTEFDGFVDLMFKGTYSNFRVQKPGWPNDLLNDQAAAWRVHVKRTRGTACKHRH